MPEPAKEMIRAAKRGSVDLVESLLQADPALIGARDKDGSTPLHCATWKGHQAVVELLLRSGADVNAHNQNSHWGTTALHAAAHANQAAMAQLLIEHGADVNAKDMEGRTPLFHTAFHQAAAAAKVLKENGARSDHFQKKR